MSKYIKLGLLLLLVPLAALFFHLDPATQPIFPKCIFHSLTGLHCPGCGSQRAIHDLLHFDIEGVVQNNFLFLPALVISIYGIIVPFSNRYFNTSFKNFLNHPKTPVIIALLILLFWVIRNIPFYPFTSLAPSPF